MPVAAQTRIALRLQLGEQTHSIPLHRVHHLAGFAALTGTPEEYFLGWLTFHGEQVPVFDLGLVVCDRPTPESFGSRILIVAATGATVRFVGLAALGMTDTIAPEHAADATPLDLDGYLPMLYTMIPALPFESRPV